MLLLNESILQLSIKALINQYNYLYYNMSKSIFNSSNKLAVMVVAIASVLLAGMGMNSATYALIRGDEFPVINADDVGQSLECVIVVVGCDGTGSVGSSGDTIIGSNNGNANNNTNGNNGNGGLQSCEECFDALTSVQMTALLDALDVSSEADLCVDIENGNITAFVLFDALVSDSVGLSVDAALEILDCLGLESPIG